LSRFAFNFLLHFVNCRAQNGVPDEPRSSRRLRRNQTSGLYVKFLIRRVQLRDIFHFPFSHPLPGGGMASLEIEIHDGWKLLRRKMVGTWQVPRLNSPAGRTNHEAKYHLGQPSHGLGPLLSWSGALSAAGSYSFTRLRASDPRLGIKKTFSFVG